MSTQNLVQRLQALRDGWCILRKAGDGKPELAVCLRRPSEAELPDYRPSEGRSMHQIMVQAVCHQAVGWRGMSEAELFGAAIGSADELPFDSQLWAEVVRDRQEWLNAASAHLMDAINTHLQQRAAAAKN